MLMLFQDKSDSKNKTPETVVAVLWGEWAKAAAGQANSAENVN